MKKILVTGAAGYIGSVLVPKLLERNYEVIAIDRFFFGKNKLQEHACLTCIQEDSRKLTASHFKDVHAVIDLVAVSNDPSGELFSDATWQINFESRANTARLAKEAGVERYILPSSCSIYGFQNEVVDETAKTNPLTVYAKANEKAEKAALALSDKNFCVTVMRQSTIFGYSPRMRLDLAINGMTYGAWKTKKLPLMRDGKQYRPMVHIQDTTDVMCLLLTTDTKKINAEIFNIGGETLNYQVGELAKIVADTVEEKIKEPIAIEWYGDPDHRSYRVDFSKIQNTLSWQPLWDAQKGVEDILSKLLAGSLKKTKETITLDWYQYLESHQDELSDLKMYGGMLNINAF
jgi:nucleoside-diphosphate-sugar epimerase